MTKERQRKRPLTNLEDPAESQSATGVPFAGTRIMSGTDSSCIKPSKGTHMAFPGLVFIGYPMEQSIAFVQHYNSMQGLGAKGPVIALQFYT
jgi:hypothetical protein